MSWEDSGLRRWIAAAPERERNALDRLGKMGQTVARARARIRTGRMRDELAWNPRLDRLEGGAPYTPYNEFGTRYMRAQPMLEPAADVMGAAIPEEYDRAFD